MKHAALAVLVFGIPFASKPAVGLAPTGGIGVYVENPFYWEYQGKPVLLLGGSTGPKETLNDEGMFLWPDVAGSLDKLASAGGNYTRCLMSGRLRSQGEPLWPFLSLDGRFDLDRWDETYWRCFESFLVATKKRGIWMEPAQVLERQPVTLSTPGEGQWAVLVRATRIPR
jgi:hypothetical protein